MRWLAILAIAGCDVVWDIEPLYDCPPNDDDCDELLDDVDPCPADPGDDADEDADAVGDACDPNLAMPGDVIAEFEGFALATAAWTVMPGDASWGVEDSAMRQIAIADGVIERLIDPIVQPTVELVVDVTFGAEGAAVGAYVATPANIPLECRIVHHATGDDLVMYIGTGVLAMATGLPGKASDGLRIYGGQLPDGKIRCRARYGDSDGLFVDFASTLITPRAMIDRVGLRTIQASADFKAVVVYAVP